MGLSNELSQQLEGLFNRWAKVRITDAEVKKPIQLAMAPNKEVLQQLKVGGGDEFSRQFEAVCESVYEYGQSSPSQQTESTKGTVFGAYNAVTGYYQNLRNYSSDEAKLKSLLYGGTAQARTQKAFDLCQRLCSAGTLGNFLN